MATTSATAAAAAGTANATNGESSIAPAPVSSTPAVAETAPAPSSEAGDDTATSALPPGTFASILPDVEDLLELIYGVADGSEVANEDVVNKAKQVAGRIAAMKAAAMALPGGHLGNDAVSAVTRILEDEAQRKRETLRAFVDTPTPIADQLAATSGVVTAGASPAPPSAPQ